ncbi:hypothetical protein FRX31_013156 [Thalictrum thalictroides]|uniref:Uncharacterized protein n=1 Tax=Thalictrum thalictroides TaxID=46969 RepID=A0A7J6WK08_THATH|nr:hypothetical protein FRX31_013156 [Thalictrum thalictroides]
MYGPNSTFILFVYALRCAVDENEVVCRLKLKFHSAKAPRSPRKLNFHLLFVGVAPATTYYCKAPMSPQVLRCARDQVENDSV